MASAVAATDSSSSTAAPFSFPFPCCAVCTASCSCRSAKARAWPSRSSSTFIRGTAAVALPPPPRLTPAVEREEGRGGTRCDPRKTWLSTLR